MFLRGAAPAEPPEHDAIMCRKLWCSPSECHTGDMSFQPLRIHPGSDLRRTLEEAVCSEGGEGTGSAFVVAGIGSLANPTLRLAGAESETLLAGAYEILGLSGTLTPDGAHLHMAIADDQGRVVGGHVCYGNEVRTTAEVLLAPLPDWKLSRELDPSTGYKELLVRSKPKGSADAA
jgi:uncharacterized protein